MRIDSKIFTKITESMMWCFSLCTLKPKGVVFGALATYGKEYGFEFECGALMSPTICTIGHILEPSFCFDATGVAARQFDCNGCALSAVVALECDVGTSQTSNTIGVIS